MKGVDHIHSLLLPSHFDIFFCLKAVYVYYNNSLSLLL